MDWNEILLMIVKSLGTALAAVISGFIIYGVKYAFSWIKSKVNLSVLNNILEKVEDVVIEAVQATEQKIVDVAKAADSWDDLAKKEAFEYALSTSLDNLNDKTKKILIAEYGNLESWLTNKIETYVRNME